MKTHCTFHVVLHFTSQLHHLGKSQYTTAITRVWVESLWAFLRTVLLTTVEVSTWAMAA